MATIQSTLALQDKMSPAFSAITRAMNSTLNAMRSIKGMELGPEFAQAAADVKLAENAIDKLNRELAETPKQTENAANGFTVMKGVAVGALQSIGRFAINSIGDVISLTDQITSSSARLSLIAGEGETVAGIQQDIFEAAQRSRGEYLEMVDSVGKLKLLAGDAFSSTQEAILFAEQLNKQFSISGTELGAATGATRQLIQALGSGALRGDELNSVFEAAPTIIQSIADYLKVPIGSIRDMAKDGKITADIIKKAMFSAAEKTNEKFAQMPMTIGQIGTLIGNKILVSFQPALQAIGDAARWIYDNWSTIEPLLISIGAAIGAITVAWGVYTIVQWVATGAAQAFFATLLANPLTWIVVVIGAVVFAIAQWVQSVGGMEVAWLIASDAIMVGWDFFLNQIAGGVYFVINCWNDMGLGIQKVGNGIVDFIGSVRISVIKILQDMANTAVDIVNNMIAVMNNIPGIDISPIGGRAYEDTGTGHKRGGSVFTGVATSAFDFADIATAEFEAESAERARIISEREKEIEFEAYLRAEELTSMYEDAEYFHAERQAEIDRLTEEKKKAELEGEYDTAAELEKILAAMPVEAYDPAKDPIKNVTSGSGSSAALRTTGEVKISGEDIKMLLDIATRKYQIDYQQITPEIILQGVTIHESADMDTVMNVVAERIYEIANADLRTPA